MGAEKAIGASWLSGASCNEGNAYDQAVRRFDRWLEKGTNSHHASDLSMTSSLTNASMHCSNVTFELPRVDGMGKVRYMKVLYVVDV